MEGARHDVYVFSLEVGDLPPPALSYLIVVHCRFMGWQEDYASHSLTGLSDALSKSLRCMCRGPGAWLIACVSTSNTWHSCTCLAAATSYTCPSRESSAAFRRCRPK